MPAGLALHLRRSGTWTRGRHHSHAPFSCTQPHWLLTQGISRSREQHQCTKITSPLPPQTDHLLLIGRHKFGCTIFQKALECTLDDLPLQLMVTERDSHTADGDPFHTRHADSSLGKRSSHGGLKTLSEKLL